MPKKGYKQTEEHKKKHLSKTTGNGNGKYMDGRCCDNKREYHKIKSKEWEKRNPEKVAHKSFLNRRRLKDAEGSFTLGEWRLLKKQYGYTCPCCGKKEPEIKLTKDHIIPLAKGGSNYIENIQPLCGKCNSEKHTKIIRFNNIKSNNNN